MAQDDVSTAARGSEAYGPAPPVEPCTEEQEAAIISGEIVVCRRIIDQSRHRISSESDAETRYARETMDKGAPRAPDVAGPGIFRGPATISGLCIIGPCPPPKAIMIDLAAIPEAPPGSDADRVARGLAPRGDERGSAQPEAGEDVATGD